MLTGRPRTAFELIPESVDLKDKIEQLQTPIIKRRRSEENSENDSILGLLNTLGVSEMAGKLELIGEKRAAAIVLFRNANGPFSSVDGVLKVPGFGKVLFEKFVKVNGRSAKRRRL
jgi:competence ComEA-like helix-hairpin-helix protein